MKNFFRSLKAESIIFIAAFTFTILFFSIGISANNSSEKNKGLYNDPERNKRVYFNLNEDIEIGKIKEILTNNNVAITLNYYYSDRNEFADLNTIIKHDNYSQLGELRDGKFFSGKELESDQKIGVFSAALDGEEKFKVVLDGKEIEIQKVGDTFYESKNISIPNELFYKIAGSEGVMNRNVQFILSGEESEIEKAFKEINSFVKNINKNNKVTIEAFNIDSVGTGKSTLQTLSILVTVITIINSIGISNIWISGKKKELVIRKVCGAEGKDLFKLFFGELSILSFISMIIAISVQAILSFVTKGIFLGIDIRLNIIYIIISCAVAIGTAFLVAITAYNHQKVVQPIEMLRRE